MDTRKKMRNSWVWTVLAALAIPNLILAQGPFPMRKAGPQVGQQPPLFYTRISGPEGMKVSYFTGTPQMRLFDAPTLIGFRPGYGYRVALSNIKQMPTQSFFASIEVRGTLLMADNLRVVDFPAGLNFTLEDFIKASRGHLIKKVIVLERPDRAIPRASDSTRPIEITTPDIRDPLIDARELGQPLMIVHLGPRQFTAEEMAQFAIPGTVVSPGDQFLQAPTVGPWLNWGFSPVFDPVHGPQHPNDFMMIFDGGDSKFSAGVTRQGNAVGVDATDTVATYFDAKGVPQLVKSNRVGICVPRFVVFRNEKQPFIQTVALAPNSATHLTAQTHFQGQRKIIEEGQQIQLQGVGSRLKASGTTNLSGTAIIGEMQGLEIKTTLKTVHEVDGACLKPTENVPDLPLLIIKWPDKCGALVGEVVTFYLRYTNQGMNPISNIVVTDSLSGRFDYVDGSQKADRQSLFSMQPNEAGSMLLRWEIPGTLLPRESGTIQFQVRVR